MKRRNFISSVGAAVALPAIMGKTSIAQASPMYRMLAENSPEDNENILILIQLNGGNDGLNTIIPIDQYDNLAKVRSNVLVPENQILKINDETGLHPSMDHLWRMNNDGLMGVVQSVCYPNPNLSHFRATDIWTSGSGSEKYVSSGWLGRYLSIYHPDYPDSYPTEKFPDPLSLTIGSTVSTTCQGFVNSMGIAFNSFEDFYELDSFIDDNNGDTFAIDHIRFINQLIEQTNQYTKSLERARDTGEGSTNSTRYPETAFGRRMESVAHLINGGLKTKIYVVTLSGFDTHAAQIETEGQTEGLHSELLRQVSHAIDGAYKDLKDAGNSGKVLFMTFSEFGRRINDNASMGTDHGTAAPMIFVGEKVNPMIHGHNPIIPANVTNNDNIEMQYDYRSVYYSVIKDWFDVPDEDFERISLAGYEYIPIIKTDTKVQTNKELFSGIKIYPNPSSDYITIESTFGKDSAYSIIDIAGKSVMKIAANTVTSISNLPTGTYVVLDSRGVPVGRFVRN